MRQVRGNKIGMVYQDPMTALNPTMTIGEQVAEPITVHLGLGKRAALERAAEVLDLVGMPMPRQRLKDYPHQLSGGLRQRVVIAMALACEPDLLIADEPTTALDVSIQAQILELLGDLIERLNMGLLLITHDMGVVADRTDRVMVMYAGQIVESSDTWTLFNELKHPYAEALFDSIPKLEMDRGQTLYSIPGMPPDLSDPPTGCSFAPRCRYAKAQCLETAPTLHDDGDSHAYACFFPVHRTAGVSSSDNRDRATKTVAPAWRASDPQGGTPRSLLVVDHVVKEFPIRRGIFRRTVGAVQAVSDVSLEVARGETFGLVGESGFRKDHVGAAHHGPGETRFGGAWRSTASSCRT